MARSAGRRLAGSVDRSVRPRGVGNRAEPGGTRRERRRRDASRASPHSCALSMGDSWRLGTHISDDEGPRRQPGAPEHQAKFEGQYNTAPVTVRPDGTSTTKHFHGAFTGGFSAGYYNSVGSAEGWTPSEWRSSRAGGTQEQQAEDFMDDEDRVALKARGALVATADFAKAAAGPSRGGGGGPESTRAPPREGADGAHGRLAELLRVPTGSDSVGHRMLRQMGWREGFGAGARVERRRPRRAAEPGAAAGGGSGRKVYGAARGPPAGSDVGGDSGGELSDEEGCAARGAAAAAARAPRAVEHVRYELKADTFGVGYEPHRAAPELAAAALRSRKAGGGAARTLGAAAGLSYGELEDELGGSRDMQQFDTSLGGPSDEEEESGGAAAGAVAAGARGKRGGGSGRDAGAPSDAGLRGFTAAVRVSGPRHARHEPPRVRRRPLSRLKSDCGLSPSRRSLITSTPVPLGLHALSARWAHGMGARLVPQQDHLPNMAGARRLRRAPRVLLQAAAAASALRRRRGHCGAGREGPAPRYASRSRFTHDLGEVYL